MPPAPTQNLNAKLAGRRGTGPAGSTGLRREATRLSGSAPPVRIVGAASSYRGGYHLSGR